MPVQKNEQEKAFLLINLHSRIILLKLSKVLQTAIDTWRIISLHILILGAKVSVCILTVFYWVFLFFKYSN